MSAAFAPLPVDELSKVRRSACYFKSGDTQLFGCWHTGPDDPALDVVAVLCNPLGMEYMSGHRSIRNLADALSLAGVATLRFDYGFCGDSSGGDFEGARVDAFVADVHAAVAHVKSTMPGRRVVLVGVGLGATFAALAARTETDLRGLVLWNPTISGRRFVREQKLMSELLNKELGAAGADIDAAGVFLTPELQQDFRAIDLAGDPPCVQDVLVVGRDDMDQDGKVLGQLADQLAATGSNVARATLPGYREMMNNPTDTRVPLPAIDHLRDWICSLGSATDARPEAMPDTRELVLPDGIREQVVTFGEAHHLAGIVTFPPAQSRKDVALVLLNCGSEHHTGPHRMYTMLARNMASHGYLCFRFDIEGIGDSVTRGRNPENNAYSPVAFDDIDTALTYLSASSGIQRFILAGICAGAYHAFQASSRLQHHDIVRAILINPLVFEWDYDQPENHFEYKLHTYKGAWKDPGRWRKLLRGRIDRKRLVSALSAHASARLQGLFRTVGSLLTRRPAAGVPLDLDRIQRAGRRLDLVLSAGDPGLDLLELQGGGVARQAIRDGLISVHDVPGANHGFSKKVMQDRLLVTLQALLPP